MCEELSYQIINTTAVNQNCFLLLLEVCKNHYKKKTLVLAVARNAKMHFFEFI